jgi:hypothetical protein
MLVMLVLIRELVEKEPRFGVLNEYLCVVTLLNTNFLEVSVDMFSLRWYIDEVGVNQDDCTSYGILFVGR